MQRIRVTGLRSDLERVIGKLHNMGEVQFRKISEGYFYPEAPLENFADISEQLVRMRGMEAVLKPQAPEVQQVGNWREVVDECRGMQLDALLKEIVEGRDALRRSKAEIKVRMALLLQISPLKVDFSSLRCESISLIVGKLDANAAKLEGAKDAVRKAARNCELKTADAEKGKALLLIACEKGCEQDVREALAGFGFSEIPIDTIEGNPARALELANREMAEIAHEEARLKGELEELSGAHWARVAALREALEIEEQRCTAAQKFGRTASMFMFEGWIVASKLEIVAHELDTIVGGRVLIQTVKAPHASHAETHGAGHESQEEKAPTLLLNPRALTPFEQLIGIMSVPSSDEIDPTPIFAITFPLIYGMIVGDFGYGFVSIFIGWWLMKKFKGHLMQAVSKTWMMVAIPAMVFGIIYDEYFGFSSAHLLGLPPGQVLYHGLHRLEDTTLLMVLMVCMGALHIFLGLLLGAINAFSHGDRRHGMAKLGWMGVEIGGIALIVGMLFHMLPYEVAVAGGILFGISLVPIFRAEGVLGITEIAGMASNILSYARIMAVGVAGVVIAENIINKMFLPDPSQGIMFFVILPIFIVLHLFNTVLAMFEALVQGARLNMVEFFSKFYRGGGIPFAPFRVERKNTSAEGTESVQ
jgi:V/A-type H+-transporting ATPase subunit I